MRSIFSRLSDAIKESNYNAAVSALNRGEAVSMDHLYYAITEFCYAPINTQQRRHALEIIELLTLRLDVNQKLPKINLTPLEYALKGNGLDAARHFLRNCPYIDMAANSLALSYAAGNDDPEIIEILISKGADINFTSDRSVTPIMIAAKSRNPLTFATLLKYGPELLIEDLNGHNVFDYIVKNVGANAIVASDLLLQIHDKMPVTNTQVINAINSVCERYSYKPTGLINTLLSIYPLEPLQLDEILINVIKTPKVDSERIMKIGKYLLDHGANPEAKSNNKNISVIAEHSGYVTLAEEIRKRRMEKLRTKHPSAPMEQVTLEHKKTNIVEAIPATDNINEMTPHVEAEIIIPSAPATINIPSDREQFIAQLEQSHRIMIEHLEQAHRNTIAQLELAHRNMIEQVINSSALQQNSMFAFVTSLPEAPNYTPIVPSQQQDDTPIAVNLN